MARKITVGRRRLEMKKIEKETALQVTFSKRRAGVFKKASELAILCGAEVLIVVFSPAGRPYTFGSPDVDTIMQRFLTGNPTRPSVVDPYGSSSSGSSSSSSSSTRGVMLRQKVREYTDMVAARDMKQAQLHELKKIVKESRVLDVESLEVDELQRVLGSMLELRGRLASHLDHLNYVNSLSSLQSAIVNPVVPDDYVEPQYHNSHGQLVHAARPTMTPYVIGAGHIDGGVPVCHPRQHTTNPILDQYYGGSNPGGGGGGVVFGHHHRHGDHAMAPAVATGVSMGLFNGGLMY